MQGLAYSVTWEPRLLSSVALFKLIFQQQSSYCEKRIQTNVSMVIKKQFLCIVLSVLMHFCDAFHIDYHSNKLSYWNFVECRKKKLCRLLHRKKPKMVYITYIQRIAGFVLMTGPKNKKEYWRVQSRINLKMKRSMICCDLIKRHFTMLL